MASGALPLDRLRQFLRELPSPALTLLITELERAVLRGDEVPGGDMLLQEVRAAVRDSGKNVPRFGAPARAFFRPLEPFLIDVKSDRKVPGRIARTTLEPVWDWISRDLAPAEAKVYCDGVSRALSGGDDEPPDSLVHSFQAFAAGRMRSTLDAIKSDDKARRRMSNLIATPNMLDVIKDIQTIVSSRDTLDLIASRMPGHIRNLGGGVLDNMKRRRDVNIAEDDFKREIVQRLERSLLPMITRTLQFRATRIERYLVACYDADEGGWFQAHRDNETLGTAHRRFACSINLNAEEFEGGDLRFPEF